MENRRFNKRAEDNRTKVVCIGGGTGSASLLRGLKKATKNITAIVAVSDDGGGSGVLRDELGMPPPGDIRNCIQALSNAEPILEKLMGYRFDSGRLDGQSFGNLFLAAITGISDSFDRAVVTMGEVLSITGKVLPVATDDMHLWVEFEDGTVAFGESKIAEAKKARKSRIKRTHISPKDAKALPECVSAIENADIIILGPGSLYTSIIPNILIEDIAEAIVKSNALKLYICNVMTEPGETDGYTISDHVSEIFKHAGKKLFDYCIVNSATADWGVLERYVKDGAEPVVIDEDEVVALGVNMIKADIASTHRGFVRHDSDKLTKEIMELSTKNAQPKLLGE